MALKKDITNQHGMTCEYWRIIQLNQNYDRLDAVITIALYEHRAQRLIGLPFMSYKFDIGCCYHDDEYLNGNDIMRNITLKEGYRMLKQLAIAEQAKPLDDPMRDARLAWFHDAEDVLE